VTIIVGIISKAGIVLASDSQTTYQNSSSKRTDTDKMSMITFSDNKHVLVAQSGNAELCCRALEEFERLAKSVRVDDYRKPIEVLEEALRVLKQDVTHLNNWESSREFAHEFFQDPNNNFGLMVAYYYGAPPLPCMYIVNFWPGIASRQYRFATLGCGSTVAEFILSRAKVSEMVLGDAMMAGIQTVEEVKKVDAFCGGQTKIGVSFPNGTVALTDSPRLSYLIKCAGESMELHEEETRQAWKAMMDKIANEALAKCNAKFPKEMTDEQNE
jgi:20S proteasome alpha/beta subunit